jgi:hypothetical protein
MMIMWWKQSISFSIHIGARSLALYKLSCIGADPLALCCRIELIILLLHLLRILRSKLALCDFEQLFLRSIYLHQFDPVPHAREDHSAWRVPQKDVACVSTLAIYFVSICGWQVLVAYMNGQYLQYIARVDALLVDSVEDGIASALNNALSSLH